MLEKVARDIKLERAQVRLDLAPAAEARRGGK
jgi:hypothetical protein